MSRELDLAPPLEGLSSAARRAFQAAVRAVAEGDRARAHVELEAALAHDPEMPGGRLIAAQVRHALGQHQRALDELDRIPPGEADRAADALRYAIASPLGWTREARDVIERRVHEPGAEGVRWRARAVRLYGSLGDPARALQHLDAARATSPPSAKRELSAAHLASTIGQHARARASLDRALRLEPTSAPLRAAAAQMLAGAGAFDEALAHADRAAELAAAPASHAVRAQLSLWAGDLDGAGAHAARALALEPAHPPGLRIRGAVALLRRDARGALDDLDESIRRDPHDAEARAWRGEALLRLGRHGESAAECARAVSCAVSAGDDLFAAHVLAAIAALSGDRDHDPRDGAALRAEIEHGAIEIAPVVRDALASAARADLLGALELVLAALGGNRSAHPTWLEGPGASPRPLRARTGPRSAARAALGRLRLGSTDGVLAELAALQRDHPGSPYPSLDRGRAQLWLGRYDGARSDLEHAIALGPRDPAAHRAMAVLETIEGSPERALTRTELLLAHVERGEAYRRLGRLPEAAEELDIATRAQPSHVAAWLLLALTHDGLQRPDAAAAIHARLLARAPGLLSDAALAIGVDDAAAPDARARVLESALGSMRGNRSARTPTYVTHRGALRSVPQGAVSDVDPQQTSTWLTATARLLAERLPPPPKPIERPRGTDPHRDVEMLALRAGLRRAVRLTLGARELGTVTDRLERAGWVLRVHPSPGDYEGERRDVVVVARTQEDAEAAIEAERSADVRALGALLGFPACCVDTFARRAGYDDGVGQQYEGAVAAWVPRPSPRLNNLLFGLGVRFVSFEPCRYDCPAATAAADTIAAALGQLSPETCARFDEQLARSVAIDAGDARAIVRLEGRSIVGADAVPALAGRPPGPRAELLAQRLVGCDVGAGGTVTIPAHEPVRVIDFAWATRASTRDRERAPGAID